MIFIDVYWCVVDVYGVFGVRIVFFVYFGRNRVRRGVGEIILYEFC